ncbi:hypothetical protein ES703_106692 [subsurface metagenome]
MIEQAGHRVIGTITGAKGKCSMGYKVGDQFELSGHNRGGLCGYFYHVISPYIIMLQFGGCYPPEWGGSIIRKECTD